MRDGIILDRSIGYLDELCVLFGVNLEYTAARLRFSAA
jgi:hypothetical protein